MSSASPFRRLRVALWCEFSSVTGGEQSLLAALDCLRDRVAPVFLAPAAGRLADELGRSGFEHVPLDVRDTTGRRRPQDAILDDLRLLVATVRPDLLHANSLSLARFTGAGAESLPCPVTAHVRDIVRLSAAAMRDINRNQRLIAVSQAVADAHTRQGLDARLLLVLHNGVDVDRFRPPRPEEDRLAIRERLQIPKTALLALAVGQIGVRKGLDVLLDAIGPLLQRESSLHLAVAGERYSGKGEALDYERRLRAAISPSRSDDRVHWLGYRHDMPELFRSANLLIHAARQEPFGRVLLEAAATGLPIVATDVGGTREMLSDGESALLVPPDDSGTLRAAIERLVNQPETRDRLGSAARRRVAEQFPIARAANQLCDVWSMTTELATRRR